VSTVMSLQVTYSIGELLSSRACRGPGAMEFSYIAVERRLLLYHHRGRSTEIWTEQLIELK
jgi:hypothetical protein